MSNSIYYSLFKSDDKQYAILYKPHVTMKQTGVVEIDRLDEEAAIQSHLKEKDKPRATRLVRL